MKCTATTGAYILILLFLVLSAMNAGCASILSGSTQLVTFTSTPDPAHIEIISKRGQVINRLTTPTSIELKRGRGYFQGADLTVRARAEGYTEKQIPVPTRLNGWYIGNLVFGGLIGLLIVDPATGAMYRFPDQVHINLTEGGMVGLKRTEESGTVSYERARKQEKPQKGEKGDILETEGVTLLYLGHPPRCSVDGDDKVSRPLSAISRAAANAVARQALPSAPPEE